MVLPRGIVKKGRHGPSRPGDIAMSNTAITRDQTEDEMIVYEVSDEILEAAGSMDSKGANYTLFYCTALDLCPGP
jgi:hypothetical protein